MLNSGTLKSWEYNADIIWFEAKRLSNKLAKILNFGVLSRIP